MLKKINKYINPIIYILGFGILFLYILGSILTLNEKILKTGRLNDILNLLSSLKLVMSMILVVISSYYIKEANQSIKIQEKLANDLEEHNKNLQNEVEKSTENIKIYADELEAKAINMEILVKNMEIEIKKRKDFEEEALKQKTIALEQARFESALTDLSAKINDLRDERQICEKALFEVSEFLNVSMGALYLKKDLRLKKLGVYAYPINEGKSTEFELGEGIIGLVGKTGKEINFLITGDSKSLHFGFGDIRINQVIDLPITQNDEILGVIELCFIEPINEVKINWIKKTCEIIGTSIKISQDNEKMEHLLKTMSLSEERFRQILESTGEGLFGLDNKGVITFINPAACEILGYEEKELLGADAHSKFHHHGVNGEIFDFETSHMRAAYAEGKTKLVNDEVLWKKDNFPVSVEYLATPIKEMEKVVGAVVSFRDITKRKQQEEEIRNSQKQLQTLVDTIGSMIYMKDIAGNYLLVNSIFEETKGIGRGEILRKKDLDIFKEEIPETIVEYDKRVIQNKEVIVYEESVVDLNKEMHHYLVRKAPIMDEHGKYMLYVVLQQI